MPKQFEDCISSGGNVITKNLGKDKYMHICYDKNGKAHKGEIKTKKDTSVSEESIVINKNKLEDW